MKRIRILQIIPGIAIGDQSGGAEQYAVQISRLFPNDEFERAIFVMTCYGSPSEDAWLSLLNEEGIAVSGFIQPHGSLTKFLCEVFHSLWNFVFTFRPDIITSHTERGDLLNTLIHLFHPLHPKCVRTVHIDKQWISHPFIGKFLNNILFSLTFSFETAVSETICQQLNNRRIARLLGKEATLFHNGIDESFFTSPPRTRANTPQPEGIPDIQLKLGTIGRLTEQKGHADLFTALKNVNKYYQAHLFVIGSGPLESQLKRLIQIMGLEHYVHFLGNRNDVMDILPQLDLVISASLWEGFPTVLLEAMSQEIPVIATDISGSSELIKPGITGILVPPANPRILSDAILELLSDLDEAKKMGARARLYASQFTIQNTARNHANLYRNIIQD